MAIATENIKNCHLENRICAQKGDFHDLPFADGHVHLIVSRGAMFFWKDILDAFQEM